MKNSLRMLPALILLLSSNAWSAACEYVLSGEKANQWFQSYLEATDGSPVTLQYSGTRYPTRIRSTLQYVNNEGKLSASGIATLTVVASEVRRVQSYVGKNRRGVNFSKPVKYETAGSELKLTFQNNEAQLQFNIDLPLRDVHYPTQHQARIRTLTYEGLVTLDDGRILKVVARKIEKNLEPNGRKIPIWSKAEGSEVQLSFEVIGNTDYSN